MKLSNSLIVLALAAAVPGCAGNRPKPDSDAAPVRMNGVQTATEKLPSARVGDVDTAFNMAVTQGTVGDVVKGDEITLQDGTEIRLIGVKAPIAAFSQRVGDYYGKGALEMTRKLVSWKPVRIMYDKQVHDRRGRLLGYVYTEDGKFLQEELLKAGHAFAESFPPNTKHRSDFINWQLEAMKAKKGLWSLDPADYPVVHNIDKYVIEGLQVKRVLNGDSVELDDGTVVRYIGIDAPDSENRYKEGQVGHTAYMANRKLVAGKDIVIEYDVEPKDPHGRDLAWVYVDGKLVNEELVREGEAIVAVFPPNVKYIDRLFAAQASAATDKKGLWSAE